MVVMHDRAEEDDMSKFTTDINRISDELTRAGSSIGLMKAHMSGGGGIMAKALSSEPAAESANTMSGEAFMAKALEAVGRGHITTTQLTAAELRLRDGKLPDPMVARAVLTSQPYWPF